MGLHMRKSVIDVIDNRFKLRLKNRFGPEVSNVCECLKESLFSKFLIILLINNCYENSQSPIILFNISHLQNLMYPSINLIIFTKLPTSFLASQKILNNADFYVVLKKKRGFYVVF